MVAVSRNGLALQFAEGGFKEDEEVVMAAVEQNGMALEFASETLKGNEAVVTAAVKQNAMALQYASETLKGKLSIVKPAVVKKVEILQFLDVNCEEIEKVVKEAIKIDFTALQYASETLKENEGVVMAAVEQNGIALQYTSETSKENKGVVMVAVSRNGLALQFAEGGLKEDEEVVMAAVSRNGMALEFAEGGLKEDKGVVMAAVDQDGMALQYVSEKLRGDLEICELAIEQSGGYAIGHVAPHLIDKNPELVLTAMKKDPSCIFELDKGGSLATRRVEDPTTRQVSHPIPVTVQSKYFDDKKVKLGAATYGGYIHPDDQSRTLVYKIAGVVSAKKDIGSDSIRHLPQNLQTAYSRYTQTEQTSDQHRAAYAKLYVTSKNTSLISQINQKILPVHGDSVEVFEGFLDQFDKWMKEDLDLKKEYEKALKEFRTTSQMEAKLTEKAGQLQANVSRSSKHTLHHLFSKNQEFKTLKGELSDKKSGDVKEKLLLFLIQHKAKIPDFTRVIHKLYQKTPAEIVEYLKKGSQSSDKPLEIKKRLNEAIHPAEAEIDGWVAKGHRLEILKAELEEIQGQENEGKSLYTPPSCFGMRTVDMSQMAKLRDIWEECNQKGPVKASTIARLTTLMQTDFDHVMPSLVGLTKGLSKDESQAIWQAVGEYVESAYAESIQKNQIGHYLLCQLIIENNTDSFQTNYHQLRDSLKCDWGKVESQFFQISAGGRKKIMPGKILAEWTRNQKAIDFFK